MSGPLLSSLAGDAQIAALFAPEADIRAMLEVEAALAEAQGALGILSPVVAARIASVCRDIRPDEEAIRRGLVRDGVPVPELVRQLRAAIDSDHADDVHVGATSQDIVDTGSMLRLKAVFGLLNERLVVLLSILDRLAGRHGAQRLMAQTRMQAALPFTVAAKLRTWRDPLSRHAQRLAEVRAALPVQLGGPVGDGSSFGGHAAALRAAMAERLGLADGLPWQSAREPVMEVGQALALLSGTMGKIGQDIALMAQNEVATLKLSGGGGSSAMAHKQNPVSAEVLVALARFNAGLLGTLHQSMVHENERSGAAWTLEWMVLPQMAETAGASLRHAAALLEGASFPEIAQ
ncbi:3-carboxy-cis,cis-muconate cycloisomerase [Aureimonas populi]|uniref:3-carboxy-cis,cis-muconate cycloisomerase n=1 Tax=Aureimonas populi TaxID=1701758 RepID=A0ABW5CGF0_9HYPH|nr:3-carboxy-cis,cis-muconate cycloisomerase [Aureimonas populi]